MRLVQTFIILLCLPFLLISTSCKQERKTHIIISEGLGELTKRGIKKEMLLHSNKYVSSWACLFDGRMTFESLELEVALQNQEGRNIKVDTLSFQLAKDKGLWCDKNVMVHEAKANKQVNYQLPYSGIYKFRLKLLHHKNLNGILGLSLELNPQAKS